MSEPFSVKHNGQLITAGVLFVIFGLVCAFFPGLTIVSIAWMVGAAFVLSGIVDIITYNRNKDFLSLSGWVLAYGILDILIGAMFLIHPVAFAAVVPWMIGGCSLVFGIFEISESIAARRAGFALWGWLLISGILTFVIGVLFFIWPETLAIWISLFALMRGASLIILGWNSRKFV